MQKRPVWIWMILAISLPMSVMAGTTNTTPYAEGFEDYWRGLSLAGTNGWETGTGSSALVTNTVMGGTFKYFYAVNTNHDYCLGMNGWVTNRLSSPANARVWTEMLLPPVNQRVFVGGADGKEYFSFWATNTGQFYIRHSYLKMPRPPGTRQIIETPVTNVVVGSNEWVRVSIDQDYSATSPQGYNSFRLLVNGRPLLSSGNYQYTNNIELGNTTGAGEWYAMLESNTDAMGMIWVRTTNGTAYLEDLVVRTNTPDFSAITRGQVSITGVDTNAEVMGFQPGVCRVTLDSGATNRYIWATYNTGGSAVPYQDYVPMSGVVGIPPGATNADIHVIPRKGPAGDREVLITLVSNAYTTVGTPSSAVVRIVNEIDASTSRQKGPSSRMTGLTISEIMYHPALRSDGRDGEFVELFNSEPVDADLSGYRLSGDISYTFATGTVLKARSYLVVAKDISAYLNIPDVFGPFTGSLKNGGGGVSLKNPYGALLLTAEFSGGYPWPASADGSGHSLTLAKPDYGEGDIRAWSASSGKGGSPGGADSYNASSYDGLVINELVVHTDPPLVDSIELFNSTTNSINISGCWLSDEHATNKFQITNGTTLGPRAFINYTQTNFVFGLSMTGGGVYLVSSNNNCVIDAVQYSAQSNGASFGRYPDGTSGFQTLVSRTLGSSNAVPEVGAIVINEIMYHPISGNDDDQYVELFNRGASTVDVGYWKFVEGIDYIVPPGTTIASSNYLVVARNVTNMLSKYTGLSGKIVGNFSGRLSGRGERVVLARPDDPELPAQDYVTQDEVACSSGWGDWSDGGGSSLELRDPHSDNRLGMNWAGSDESQKSTNLWTMVDYTDSVDNGVGGKDPLEIWSVGAGEYVVDELLVTTGSTTNFYDNLEGASSGWTFSGSLMRSSVDANAGYTNSKGLYVRSSDRGECDGSDGRFINHIEKNMLVAPVSDQHARIRAKVRWVCGFPFLKIGTSGHWLATPGDMTVPANLGTPGLRNSSWTNNCGPAICDVSQSPVLPAANSNVVITCGVYDPDGVAAVTLKYRVDAMFVTNTLAMNDNGTNGDAVAQDGVYSTTMPGAGRAGGAVVAFVIDASDGAGVPSSSRYPSRVVPKRAPYECYICWGMPSSKGSGGLPTYRAIISQANSWTLDNIDTRSREPAGCTCVYEDYRVIYGADLKNHAGYDRKGFWFSLPGADPLLGVDQILIQVQTPFLKYSYAHWLCGQMGEPSGIIKPAAYARNSSALSLEFDYLCASKDLCSAWFNDSDPEVFKNEEYGFDGFSMYTNKVSGGMKKSAYAAVNNKRAEGDANDDYSQVFKIADAVYDLDSRRYVPRAKAVVDVRSWASFFGVVGLLGDSDHYGYSWVHNYYVYIPPDGRSRLMLHDTDWIFDQVAAVRWPTGHPVPNQMFCNTPTFTRTYWSLLKDAADGPMVPEKTDKWFDDWCAAILTNGFVPDSTTAFKTRVVDARTAVYSGLAAIESPLTITTRGGADFSTNANPVTLSGTTPVYAETICINGNPYYVTYPGITNWQAQVWLGSGTNQLAVTGYDHAGALVGTDTIAITYTGTVVSVESNLVINEIMYNAAVPYASYVELYNKSTNTLSVGGLRIDGIDCDIGYGYMIAPTGYVVVAGNISGYQAAYGNAEVVVGEFAGIMDNAGETLKLLKPDGLGGWTVLDEVTYANTAPWPVAADGGGPSLQLKDALQDNNRVGNWASDTSTQYTPGARNSVTTNLPAFDLVWINEIMPANSIFTNNLGACTPWAELYNAGTNNVTLGSGYYLSDSYTNLTRWAFPGGVVITNGKYLLVWCDGGTTVPGYLHSSFVMNSTSGRVVLARVSGTQTTIIDHVEYSGLGTNQSYGSHPEGSQFSKQVFHYPTPGTTNNPTSDLPVVFINEWMASNAKTFDADANLHDWFELYNAGSSAVNLAGFQMAGSSSGVSRCTLPAGAIIAEKGFLRAWADGTHAVKMDGGELYVDFGLKKAGETIWLFTPDGQVVDKVVFGAQITDVGEGRWPDGGPIYQMPIWTPGASNILFSVTQWFKTGDTMTLQWNTKSGEEYYVQWSTSMLSSIWTSLATNQASSGTQTTNLTGANSWTNRFFRVRQVKP